MGLHSTPISEIQSLIMSDGLFIYEKALDDFRRLYNPANTLVKEPVNAVTYREETKPFLQGLINEVKTGSDLNQPLICLSEEYESTELPEGSIAFHRIIGPIMAEARWHFSTIQFERDFLAAEANPAISAHFFFVKSPGGETYYLDAVSKTLRNHTKPIICFVRQMCASAAYYICCHADKIICNTDNDFIGSIGTMVSFNDWSKYDEKMGIRPIEAKATNSDLKNKKTDDLIAGKPKQFIEDILDPLNEQFLSEVQASRPIIGKMERTNPVLRGEIYRAAVAITPECGLVDEIASFEDAVQTAFDAGQSWINKQRTNRSITRLL